jgi:hypothetical protein
MKVEKIITKICLKSGCMFMTIFHLYTSSSIDLPFIFSFKNNNADPRETLIASVVYFRYSDRDNRSSCHFKFASKPEGNWLGIIEDFFTSKISFERTKQIYASQNSSITFTPGENISFSISEVYSFCDVTT